MLLQSRLNSKASIVKMKLVQTVVKCCWGFVDGYIAVFLHMLWCERGMSLKMGLYHWQLAMPCGSHTQQWRSYTYLLNETCKTTTGFSGNITHSFYIIFTLFSTLLLNCLFIFSFRLSYKEIDFYNPGGVSRRE